MVADGQTLLLIPSSALQPTPAIGLLQRLCISFIITDNRAKVGTRRQSVASSARVHTTQLTVFVRQPVGEIEVRSCSRCN